MFIKRLNEAAVNISVDLLRYKTHPYDRAAFKNILRSKYFQQGQGDVRIRASRSQKHPGSQDVATKQIKRC